MLRCRILQLQEPNGRQSSSCCCWQFIVCVCRAFLINGQCFLPFANGVDFQCCCGVSCGDVLCQTTLNVRLFSPVQVRCCWLLAFGHHFRLQLRECMDVTASWVILSDAVVRIMSLLLLHLLILLAVTCNVIFFSVCACVSGWTRVVCTILYWYLLLLSTTALWNDIRPTVL